MKNFITRVFLIVFTVTFIISVVVGISWLFDYKPNNLYFIWSVCYKSLAVSFLFYLLFGRKITLI